MLGSTPSILSLLVFLVGAGAGAQSLLPPQERTAPEKVLERRDDSSPLPDGRERVQERHGGVSGLPRLFAGELANVDELSIRSLDLSRAITRLAGHTFRVRRVVSRALLAHGENGLKTARLFVAVQIENLGSLPWLATRATLSAGGESLEGVGVWQSEPLAPRDIGTVIVEVKVEPTAAQARGPFTLTLSDESGRRLLTLENVRFP